MYQLTVDFGIYTCWSSCKEDQLVKKQHDWYMYVQMPSEWFGFRITSMICYVATIQYHVHVWWLMDGVSETQNIQWFYYTLYIIYTCTLYLILDSFITLWFLE